MVLEVVAVGWVLLASRNLLQDLKVAQDIAL